MCDRCVPRLTRRDAILLAGTAAASAIWWSPTHAVAAPITPSPRPVNDRLAIVPRSAWARDDQLPLGEPEPEDVRFLLVHHTASEIGSEPIGVMRGVYDFHTGPSRGWVDVAYNFFIDQDGVVYEGRAGSLDGPVVVSATGGSQGFAQLVCLLGDFTDELPTDAARASLVETLAWLADRHDLDTAAGATGAFVSRGSNLWPEGETVMADIVSGHRDMSRTACPGDTFYPVLKSEVAALVEQQRVEARTPVTTTATDTSAAGDAATGDTASTDASSSAGTENAARQDTSRTRSEDAPSESEPSATEADPIEVAAAAESDPFAVETDAAASSDATPTADDELEGQGERGGDDEPESDDSGSARQWGAGLIAGGAVLVGGALVVTGARGSRSAEQVDDGETTSDAQADQHDADGHDGTGGTGGTDASC